MNGGKDALLKYLKTIDRNRLGVFKDAEVNNAFHYAFFCCPWRPKLQEDKKETQVFQELQAAGAAPDAPNVMGFSYRQVCEALEEFLPAR